MEKPTPNQDSRRYMHIPWTRIAIRAVAPPVEKLNDALQTKSKAQDNGFWDTFRAWEVPPREYGLILTLEMKMVILKMIPPESQVPWHQRHIRAGCEGALFW